MNMNPAASSRPLIKCPRCNVSVAYADITANDFDCSSVKLGNSARVVLEPCYCHATSQDNDFKQMVQTFERFNSAHVVSTRVTA
jgi:hypothetical protein